MKQRSGRRPGESRGPVLYLKFKTWIPAFAGMTGLLLLSSNSLFAGALQRYVSESGEVRDALPQVLIKYKPGRAAAVRSGILRSMGASPTHEITPLGIDVVPVPSGYTVQSFVDRLKKNPDIQYVEPNGVLRKLDTPDDPAFPSQYYLNANTTHVQEAWDISTGASSVVVAVIDTGASLTHQDLVNQFWVNPSPSGNSGLHGTQLKIDWNGDGDCFDTDPDLGVEQCAGSNPEDNNAPEYHGTRVSGIIAAQTNNAKNIAGVARNCRIMVIKALTAAGAGDFAAVAQGIAYAVANGAKVINMSLGGTSGSDAVTDAVAQAVATNIIVVAASGNGSNSEAVNFPASIPSVIAVGATNSSNVLASFSCTGSAIDLVAPGVGIFSTIPSSATSSSSTGGNDGTSFSAPIVAGVAALIRTIAPTLSVADVTDYLKFTATDLGESGPDQSYGHGLVNANAALQAVQAGRVLRKKLGPQVAGGETYPYPNPFNPLENATVGFALPTDLSEEGIEIKIFNAAGELVKTVTGEKQWNGRNDDNSIVAPGLYFYFAKTSRGDVKGKLTVKQ